MTKRLKTLAACGQAVWLDFVDRKFLAKGGLRKLIVNDGLTVRLAEDKETALDAKVRALATAGHPIIRIDVTASFGPRFQHSTGQAYKGGPKTGAFLAITRDVGCDFAMPGRKANFGIVQLLQARGNSEVLTAQGQRITRVHLKRGGSGIGAIPTSLLSVLQKKGIAPCA